MKDAFGWIARIPTNQGPVILAIKNALTTINGVLKHLDEARVTALEATSQHDLLSLTHLDTEPHTPPNDGDLISAADGKWGPISLGAAGLFLTSTGSTVDWDTPDGGIPAAHHTSHEIGGTDVVAAGKIRETSGPTDLTVGIITNGEFLKRVGATIVSAAPPGGSTPTGTGFYHVTAGVMDAASKLVDTADINNSQVTLAKMANLAASTVIGRSSAGAGVPVAVDVISPLTINPSNQLQLGTVDVVHGGTGQVAITGTGFPHITAGAFDGASKLVDTVDINNDQVTFAKTQNIASVTVLGRSSIGTGDIEVLTLGAGLTIAAGVLINTVTAPSTSYSPGSFTIATENYYLMSNHLKLTGAQRLIIQGTGRLRIT